MTCNLLHCHQVKIMVRKYFERVSCKINTEIVDLEIIEIKEAVNDSSVYTVPCYDLRGNDDSIPVSLIVKSTILSTQLVNPLLNPFTVDDDNEEDEEDARNNFAYDDKPAIRFYSSYSSTNSRKRQRDDVFWK